MDGWVGGGGRNIFELTSFAWFVSTKDCHMYPQRPQDQPDSPTSVARFDIRGIPNFTNFLSLDIFAKSLARQTKHAFENFWPHPYDNMCNHWI